MMCEYGHGCCTAHDTTCPHWQGTFCELDYNEKDDWAPLPSDEAKVKRNCHRRQHYV